MLASTHRASTRHLHTLAASTVAARVSVRSTARVATRCVAAPLLASPAPFAAASSVAVAPSSRRMTTHAHKALPHGPSVLVVGGNGALGQAMIRAFKEAGWKTISMDFKANTAADINIDISTDKSWNENIGIAEEKLHEVSRIKGEKSKKHMVSAMVHCAGSWMGGGVDGLLASADPMLNINLKSAITTAHLAGKFLDSNGSGLVVLTGAAAAANQQPTPSMLAYGMSKAATHQLATSLAHKDAGLKNSTVVCILPSMIDTPSNRAMSSNESDYENWTPPAEFAKLVLSFAQQLQPPAPGRPSHKPHVEHVHAHLQNGGFYTFDTQKGKTAIKLLPPVYVPEQD